MRKDYRKRYGRLSSKHNKLNDTWLVWWVLVTYFYTTQLFLHFLALRWCCFCLFLLFNIMYKSLFWLVKSTLPINDEQIVQSQFIKEHPWEQVKFLPQKLLLLRYHISFIFYTRNLTISRILLWTIHNDAL